MTYEQLYLRRIIDADTLEFKRDIDLNYDHPNSSYVDEHGVKHQRVNEIAITAPACQGSDRIATFDENGEFVEWTNAKGQHAPKGEDDEQRQSD